MKHLTLCWRARVHYMSVYCCGCYWNAYWIVDHGESNITHFWYSETTFIYSNNSSFIYHCSYQHTISLEMVMKQICIAQFVIMLILGLMVSWWFKPNPTNMFPNINYIKNHLSEIYCDALSWERFWSTPGQVMACCWHSCGCNVDVHQPHCKNTDIERN